LQIAFLNVHTQLAFLAAFPQFSRRSRFDDMKWVMPIVLMTVTFWAGLGLGYRRGVDKEKRAWLGTAAVQKIIDSGAFEVVFKDPHNAAPVRNVAGDKINRADPRLFEQFKHSQP
jgi:hypothetical protein